MKQNQLERFLQKVPAHPRPDPALEQYMTPAKAAAGMLFMAGQLGDIGGKTVADLGCGTGILAAGAVLLGALKVIGVDIDRHAIETGKQFAQQNGLDIDFRPGNITDFHETVDTVVMNPPFGAQKRHADRPFLYKAFESANVVYSFHMTSTGVFIDTEAVKAGFVVTHKNMYDMSIKHLFEFHRKEKQEIDVTLFRMERGG